MRFVDKVAVVLGGNSGIGLGTAQGFAREGAQVVITGRNQETLEKAAQLIGNNTLALQSDIADVAQISAVMEEVKQRFGRIDALCVNAGIGAFKPFEEIDEADWDYMIGVNLKGQFFAVQKALPLMSSGGAIVLTSSIGHLKGIPGNSVYAASKAGVRSLARNLGAELVDRGIRVNCLSPGPIDTPIVTRSNIPADQIAAFKTDVAEKIPMKRFGTSEEVANAILFLASSESSYITGIDLLVDGGTVSF